MSRHDIPRKPFDDLVDAFLQDQEVTRYDQWEQVLGYCERSANPVGRLVLYMCGYRDERRQQLSDDTCTALQLVNFWQDVRRDILERNRVYIPADVARANGLDIEQMVQAVQLDQADIGSSACCSRRRLVGSPVNTLARPYAATVKCWLIVRGPCLREVARYGRWYGEIFGLIFNYLRWAASRFSQGSNG